MTYTSLMVVPRSVPLTLALMAAIATLAACDYRTEEFRYRLTVEVDTPQGLRSGASVVEVSISEPGEGGLPDASGGTSRLRGEAVAVDLPDGRVLFALLRAPGDVDAAARLPFHALNPPRREGEYRRTRRAADLKRISGVGELPQDHYPLLVTFRNLEDPTSIERLDPANLAGTLGKGISLRRITVQMTNDVPTTGIVERLPWLGTNLPERGYQRHNFPENVPIGDFSGMFERVY
jgi:hypothetical protein